MVLKESRTTQRERNLHFGQLPAYKSSGLSASGLISDILLYESNSRVFCIMKVTVQGLADGGEGLPASTQKPAKAMISAQEKVCQKHKGCAITVLRKIWRGRKKRSMMQGDLMNALACYLLDDRMVLNSSTCKNWNRPATKLQGDRQRLHQDRLLPR
jgi:hypothetical protein